MSRLLKSTATAPAPGTSFVSKDENIESYSSPVAVLGLPKEYEALPLKQAFDLQRKNTVFQKLFSLNSNEMILQEISSTCSISGTTSTFPGLLYLSQTFICFVAATKSQCLLSLPYFAIMRVERINSQTSTVSITARHNLKLLFQLHGDKTATDKFCELLKKGLQEHIGSMKSLKPFLATCPSEALLAGKEGNIAGLGTVYGYIDSTKYLFSLSDYLEYQRKTNCATGSHISKTTDET
jgi:hypothetical protein